MDHEHLLQQKPPGAPYTCSGCRQLGFGSSYHCQNSRCNYVLHGECVYPDPYAFHSFFEKSYFEFHKKPPGDRERYCDACGKDILGFVYHCSTTGYDLHPCCLKLKNSITDESGSVTLNLSKKDLILDNWRRGYFSQVERSITTTSSSSERETQLAVTSMEMDQRLRISRRAKTISKYTKIAIMVFKLIFAAIFGDPVTAFVAILEALASN
ncbi:uncharacterized protein LOC131613411 [Vicia villosa]|uniref:uncharacterized protein LOC131613411 n=1 Tax=Vicia villosa TaxID=3911 RepID=UPI00273AA5E2|nr:uncharacterized protein LOC131613411 [Vicia villosa]